MNKLSPVGIIGDIAGTAMACWFFHFMSLVVRRILSSGDS